MALTNYPDGISVDGYALPTNATITVGTEGTNAISVTVQLKDGNGDNLTAIAGFQWYLSGDSAGAGIVGTAPNSGVAAGASGKIAEVLADKAGFMLTDATGAAILTLTDSGTPTFYLVVILPTGKAVISSAITFAA